MKRIIIVITAALIGLTACSVKEKNEIVTVQDLPTEAQQFLETNFHGQGVSYVLKEVEWLVKTEYNVKLVRGTELDFDADGQWKKVDCKMFPVPESIIPDEILTKVAQTFQGTFITEIDRVRRGYDVELANDLEIHFDKKFNMSYDD